MVRVLLVLALLWAVPARAEDFLSRDKYFHGLGSMVLAQTGFGATLYFQEGDDVGLPWAVGAATGLVPGLVKEIVDEARPGSRFSWMDLAWDGIGAVAGLVIGQCVWLLFDHARSSE